MQRSSPLASAGLIRFEASITPPEAAPAPMTVWISSMKRIAPGCFLTSASTAFRRFSKSPRYFVPATREPMSKRIDRGIEQHLGHLILHDHAREALGDRGLADAGLADVERIVLAPPAEDLDGALDLELAADQRIDLALARGLVEVGGVLLQGAAAAVPVALGIARRRRPPRARCAPRRPPWTGRAR